MKIALICRESENLNLDDWHHYGFWYKTLKERTDVELSLYTWNNWETMPDGLDLYFFLDFRPCLYKLARTNYHPRILYWWDSFHTMFSLLSQVSLVFDKVYVAEMLDAQHLRGVGFSNVEWMPGAFYPGLYHPDKNFSKIQDYSFIGQFDDNVIRKNMTRKDMLYNLNVNYKGFMCNSIKGPIINQVYNESKILIERTIYCNIGTRLFELIGSGGFVLMNKYPCANGLENLGIDGVHFVTYDDSWNDLKNKIDYYLKNEDEREKIAKQGYELFINNHTYVHRLNKIFKDFSLI